MLELNTRDKLVKNWLYNVKTNKKNDSILVVFHSNKNDTVLIELKEDLKESFFNYDIDQTNYDVMDIKKYNSDITKNKYLVNKNIILVADKYTSLSIIRNLKDKILPYFLTRNSFKLSDNFNSKNIDNEELIDETEADNIDIIFVESIDPIDIIKRTGKEIESFLFEYMENIDYFKDGTLNNFIHDTNITGKSENLIDKKTSIAIVNKSTKHTAPSRALSIENSPQYEYLKRDIVILKEKNILTSRLAIVLYRKAFLDRYANVTEIGLYYSKEFGSKSKVVDLKKISKYTSVNYDGLSKTKVKAYDLNITTKSESQLKLELEMDIKEHIAKKLLYFTDIDIKTIQRIVELPMSTLKDYR